MAHSAVPDARLNWKVALLLLLSDGGELVIVGVAGAVT